MFRTISNPTRRDGLRKVGRPFALPFLKRTEWTSASSLPRGDRVCPPSHKPGESLTTMNKPITYGQLEEALLALGYERTEIPKSHRLFTNGDPVAVVTLPIVPAERPAHPTHVALVRSIVSGAGIMDRDEFDDFVAQTGRAAS